MASINDIGKALIATGITILAIILASSVIGPKVFKYKLDSSNSEQLYDVHTEINIDVTTNQAKFKTSTFNVRTEPTSSKTASMISNYIPFFSFLGSKNLIVTQTIQGPTGKIRKETSYGDVSAGKVLTAEFNADAWPSGTYTITYELTQSCTIIDIGLNVFCKPHQTVQKTFQVPSK